MSVTQQELGSRIRSAREACRLAEEQVAAHLGLSRPTVVQIEAGSRSVSSLELDRLAHLFGCDIRGFVAGSFDEADSLAALFAQSDVLPRPDVANALRDYVALGREITNLKRLLGIDRGTAATVAYPISSPPNGSQHRILGWALEAYRREDISRGKLDELASMLGFDRNQDNSLIDGAALDCSLSAAPRAKKQCQPRR